MLKIFTVLILFLIIIAFIGVYLAWAITKTNTGESANVLVFFTEIVDFLWRKTQNLFKS